MFAIIGSWPVDAELEAEQLDHIAANVRRQPGFVRGYWGQPVDDTASAHAVVILEDEASAHVMAEGVKAAIPAADLRVVRVLAEAYGLLENGVCSMGHADDRAAVGSCGVRCG